MTLKQIIVSVLLINIATISNTMTMNRRYHTPEDNIRYFYPDSTKATDPNKYAEDFKIVLQNNLSLLKTEYASEESVKKYEIDHLKALETLKQHILERQKNACSEVLPEKRDNFLKSPFESTKK